METIGGGGAGATIGGGATGAARAGIADTAGRAAGSDASGSTVYARTTRCGTGATGGRATVGGAIPGPPSVCRRLSRAFWALEPMVEMTPMTATAATISETTSWELMRYLFGGGWGGCEVSPSAGPPIELRISVSAWIFFRR